MVVVVRLLRSSCDRGSEGYAKGGTAVSDQRFCAKRLTVHEPRSIKYVVLCTHTPYVLGITAIGKSAERTSIRYLRPVNCASSAKKRKNKSRMAELEGRLVIAV